MSHGERGLIVVTAVGVEADAVRGGLAAAGRDDVEVHVVGVGAAAAAAGTAYLLAGVDLCGVSGVLVAGVAGGFPGMVDVGGIVLATASVAADLGAEDADGGFLPIDDLGFGTAVAPAAALVVPPGAVRGAVLSVSTVTGTAERAAALRERWPDAVAEAMEGAGVAAAAARAGVAFGEVRAVSNPIGPRDRAGWRIGDALAALRHAFAAAHYPRETPR